MGGCQDPRGADDNPAALVISKEVQGSVPWPAVRTGLLSPANALEQPPGSHRGKATAVCKSQRTGCKLSRKFSVFLDNLMEGIQLGQSSRRDQVCLSCLQWVGEGKTDRWNPKEFSTSETKQDSGTERRSLPPSTRPHSLQELHVAKQRTRHTYGE